MKNMLMYSNMKTNCYQTTRPVEIKTHSPARMKINPGSVLPALLLAGTVLLSPGWGVQRSAAQTFPGVPTDGQTFSIGVVQIVVDPNFAFLFAPAPTFAFYYPGYAGPASGILTGPVM